jgi:acyl carrier protein
MCSAEVVPIAAMPRTISGKIDYQALTDRAEPMSSAEGNGHDDPRTRQVLEILGEVLEHTDFGVDDAFFAVGGDSLSSLEAISLLRERCCIQLSLAQFLSCRTIGGLCELVTTARRADAPTAPIRRRAR